MNACRKENNLKMNCCLLIGLIYISCMLEKGLGQDDVTCDETTKPCPKGEYCVLTYNAGRECTLPATVGQGCRQNILDGAYYYIPPCAEGLQCLNYNCQDDGLPCTQEKPCPEGQYCVEGVVGGRVCDKAAKLRQFCTDSQTADVYQYVPPCEFNLTCNEGQCNVADDYCNARDKCPEEQFCVNGVGGKQICRVPTILDENCGEQSTDGVYNDLAPCQVPLTCSPTAHTCQGEGLFCTQEKPCPDGEYCVEGVKGARICQAPVALRQYCNDLPINGVYQFVPPCEADLKCNENQCNVPDHYCSNTDKCPTGQFCVRGKGMKQICRVPTVLYGNCGEPDTNGVFQDLPPCEEPLTCSPSSHTCAN